MNQTKVRPMVESGILSAIAVLFAVISSYLPLFGPLISWLWPLPIAVLGVRHGLKWSVMAVIVSGTIIAMILDPLNSIFFTVGFGPIGIVLGYAFRREFSSVKATLLGGITGVISVAIVLMITITISTGITDTNPFVAIDQAIAQGIQQAIEASRDSGVPEQELAEKMQSIQAMIDIVKVIMPSGFIMALLFAVYLNVVSAKVVLRKIGHHIPGFPIFKNWILPQAVVYFLALALVMLYWGRSRDITMLNHVGMNVYAFTTMLLLVQGLALFYYVVDKYNLSRVVKSIILLLILSNGFLSQILIFVGAVDTIIDYRRLRTPHKNEE